MPYLWYLLPEGLEEGCGMITSLSEHAGRQLPVEAWCEVTRFCSTRIISLVIKVLNRSMSHAQSVNQSSQNGCRGGYVENAVWENPGRKGCAPGWDRARSQVLNLIPKLTRNTDKASCSPLVCEQRACCITKMMHRFSPNFYSQCGLRLKFTHSRNLR